MSSSITGQVSHIAQVQLQIDNLVRDGCGEKTRLTALLRLMIQMVHAEDGRIWQAVDGEWTPVVFATGEYRNKGEAPDTPAPDQVISICEKRLAGERVFVEETRQRGLPALEYFPTSTPAWNERVACCLLLPFIDHHECYAIAAINAALENAASAESSLAALAVISERDQKWHLIRHFNQENRGLANLQLAHSVISSAGRYLDMEPMAYDVANRLNSYFEADRVSLSISRGSKFQVRAVSNQAVFDRRSHLIRAMEKLASQATRIESPTWYPNVDDAPFLAKNELEKYVDVSDAKSVVVIPLHVPRAARETPDDLAAIIRQHQLEKECVGALIIESFANRLDAEEINLKWDGISQAVSQSIANSRRFDSITWMPFWRRLGEFTELFRGHTRRKAWGILLLVVIAAVALTCIQAEFKVRGEGVLQPMNRRSVYAQTPGTIVQLMVRDGDLVENGQLLARLEDPRLESKVASLSGTLREKERRLHTLTAQRVLQPFKTEPERQEVVRNMAIVSDTILGLQEELLVVNRLREQLNIRSPMAGRVITWDVEQRLLGRPVEAGRRLMQIAETNGDWEVELRIPDRRSGYLLEKWHQSQLEGTKLIASFVLASDLTFVHKASIIEVSPNTDVDNRELDNVVRVRVKLPAEMFKNSNRVRHGTTIIGQVHCGRASIAYCKFFEFVDWVQRTWFKFIA